MAEIVVEIAKPLAELLVNRATEEILLFQDYKTELKELERKVQLIASIVGNMTTTMPDTTVETWLRRAVGIIYKAEDMFDVLAYQKHQSVVMKKQRLKKAFTGKMRIIFAPLERVIFRCKIGRHIRSITGEFEDALKEAKTITRLKAALQSPSASVSTLQAAVKMASEELQQVRRHVDMSVFIGRESDVVSVVDMLCNPSQQGSPQNFTTNPRLPVVAIIGIGGLGKTSLAKKVYEDERTISHFSERVWISDLKIFDIEMIVNKMVEYIGKDNYQTGSTDTAVRRLGECLGGKRYLLVLDDVWNTNQQCWDSLRYQLERIGGSLESMVLTTTRDDVVANTMHAFSVHRLQGLSEDNSWSLFHKIALENRSSGEAFALEDYGRKIVEKCKGVPLAVKSVAGLLQRKKDPLEWMRIEESELWDIQQQETTGILPSLKLSYDHLSSPLLKKCFSLCALWSKGTTFEKYDARDRWIALGLVQKSNDENVTMEDIANDYLDELLSISFLTICDTNEVGEATVYLLHDIVYDLARSVHTNQRMYMEERKKVNNVLDIQHITVVGNAEITSNSPNILILEKVRSLDIWKKLPRGILRHVKYLRVLSLVQLGMVELPETIGKLKCLKFLDLSNNAIRVLPPSIMELYNLQSLILYFCDPQLELPVGSISNLINLRHLGLSFDFCPPEGVIQQLSQLHTLPPLQLSEGGFQISELKSLKQISGNLEIKGLQVIKSKLDAENASLSKKARVKQLRLSWDNDDNNYLNNEEVLDGLCPHPNLKLLSIKGYGGGKFPSWLMKMNVFREHNGYAGSLCNLIKFELINCGRCCQLPTLGHLSSLKKIVITNMDKVKQIGPEFYNYYGADSLRGNGNQESVSSSSSVVVKSFASLEQLELRHLGNLVEWCEPGAGAWCGFPSLEKLVIEDCDKVERMPNDFPCLRELAVIYMRSSQALLSIISNKTSMRCLKKLDIKWVKELTHIPEELGGITTLQTLSIWGCEKLTNLPESMSNLVSLEVFIIYWCPNLVSLPKLSALGSLREFKLFKNDGLRGVPEGLQTCRSLERLWIDCCAGVETLPDLGGLSRLSSLGIWGMTKVIRQPPDWLIHSLSCLRTLNIGNYEELNEFPDLSPLHRITSLQQLNVYGWEKLDSIPQQLQLFTNLKILGIVDFENIEYLPDWLGNLSSLQELLLSRCEELKKLPSEEAMKQLTKLWYLKIEDCPLLEEATSINGLEHHKIAATRIYVEIKNFTDY